MFHGLDTHDITGYSNKLIGEIQSLQLFNDITTKHDCRGKSVIQLPIATAGLAQPHVVGADIKDYGGTTYKVTIHLSNWEAGTYIDYFLQDDNNFDYKSFVQSQGLPNAIGMRADQIVIDAMNVDTHMPEIVYDGAASLIDVFADAKISMDAAIDDTVPAAGRKLILPVAAEKAMYNNDKFMNSLYVQHQMDNIMEGKAGRFLGFDTLFVPNRREGGLHYEPQPDGKRLYTCYAVAPGGIHLAEGYGGNRVLNSGGILKVDDIPHKASWFIYIPYQAGAKVVMHRRVVRFYMLTEAV